jgi:glucose/arabinose dehydrogenase
MAFGGYPGTGIFIKKGYLYASSNDDVYRYKLNNRDEVIDTAKGEKIVVGLVNRNRDNSKSLVVDDRMNLYVNVGSYANACLEGTALTAPSPCPILDSAGGIWRFKADKKNQSYKQGQRYATGLKNVVGLDWNTQTKSLFVTHHGRDRLFETYPQLYTAEQAALTPAETMYELHNGADAGWPYVYYDHKQHKKILAPEYGGDGKKTAGENTLDPVAVFPAHLAPNGLLFYTGNMFPAKYRNGAFIAFHAKSAEIQRGYLVAFVPFKDGKPDGEWEIFADEFAGKDYYKLTTPVQHKPCGLAQGPDGALYVSDDAGGNIYRIEYGK